MLGKLIGLVLGAVFLGALAPTAITALNVSTTGWGAGPIALWGILTIVVVVGVVYLILREVGIEF